MHALSNLRNVTHKTYPWAGHDPLQLCQAIENHSPRWIWETLQRTIDAHGITRHAPGRYIVIDAGSVEAAWVRDRQWSIRTRDGISSGTISGDPFTFAHDLCSAAFPVRQLKLPAGARDLPFAGGA
ncbi:MAG: hypothetical protein KDD44_08710, partial [Bdellovibrionales bacterium]|nr:hypothetical protein [Bdellovibrionales bacterium]